MRKYAIYPFIGIAIILHLCLHRSYADEVAAELKYVDQYTLVGPKNFLKDFEPINSDGTINVVIEIPAGTAAKWEVDKKDGSLKWEFKEGKPRIVKYLGYPGNYGMVPQTLLSKELGGDGDPLDVLVLGKMVSRGSVVEAKLIGILKFLDGGEQDDKLLAVLPGTPFFDINDIQELDKKFKGTSTIIDIWFANYKGPGKGESKGIASVEEAKKVLNLAIKAYKNQ
jgi:inorganic pyrophosphatase